MFLSPQEQAGLTAACHLATNGMASREKAWESFHDSLSRIESVSTIANVDLRSELSTNGRFLGGCEQIRIHFSNLEE